MEFNSIKIFKLIKNCTDQKEEKEEKSAPRKKAVFHPNLKK